MRLDLPRTFHGLLFAVLSAVFLSCPPASAQEREAPILRLEGVAPSGVRGSVTESWGLYDFNVTNGSNEERLARVLVYFPDRPHLQYGRDVWVPAHSSLSSWLIVGPASGPNPDKPCELRMLLYDRSKGKAELIPPAGEERVRSRVALRRRREPSTAILLDEEIPQEEALGRLPQPDSRADEAIRLVQGFRLTRKLSEQVFRISSQLLPHVVEAYDGIDHFVLASNRIARDPAGMQALRHWLEQGGKVWVMLDTIEPDTLAPLLGDALDFQVVDRVSLTSFRVRQQDAGEPPPVEPLLQKHDRPVDFVRVLLPDRQQAKFAIEGWPVWFTRQIGRGTVVVSTLGARGWFQERTRRDPPSPFEQLPSFPIPTPPLEDLGWELHHRQETVPFPVEAFQPLLTEEIGYSVVGRGTVVLIFGVFLSVVLTLGIALRRSRRAELLGWLAPAAALIASSIFVLVGEASRRAAPPTVAVAQVVDAVSGNAEASIHGLLAVYRPDSGAVELDAERGGFIDWNVEGLEGQTRRLVWTDLDAWHWENLALPAGVRLAPFQTTVSTGKPLAASARFGPEGIEGRLEVGSVEGLSDVLLITRGGHNLAVPLRADHTFRAGSQDVLPKGQYLAGAVLDDRQQRRQELYRTFLKPPGVDYLQERNVLLAWANPLETHFHIGSEARYLGSALLVLPLRFERPLPGQHVTIPGPFLSYRRILGGQSTRPILTSNLGIDMHLRFQLPAEVLPFQVERARLLAKINAPSRRLIISGRDEEQLVEVHRAENPFNPLRLGIPERFLHLDREGGLHLNVTLSDTSRDDRQRGGQGRMNWTIEYIELEVSGHPLDAESRSGKD